MTQQVYWLRQDLSSLMIHNRPLLPEEHDLSQHLPVIALWALVDENHNTVRGPVRSKGLRNFEVFARCCEAWRLAQRGEAM